MKINFTSVRSRLALLYSLAIMLLLVLYSGTLYYFYQKNLTDDFDRKLRSDVETVELRIEKDPHLVSKNKIENLDSANWLSEIFTLKKERIFTTGNISILPLGTWDESCSHFGFAENYDSKDHFKVRVLCMKSEAFPDTFLIRVARSSEQLEIQKNNFLTIIYFGFPLFVVLAGLIGYLLARSALSPITAIVEKAKTISAEKLNDRLPVPNPHDELGELASTFNQTFERLERSFIQMKAFTSDASHELRTPLSIIRLMGETALKGPQTEAQYQETISNILEESSRLQHLCESLLLISRGESGTLKLDYKEVSIQHLIDEVISVIEILAEEKDQKIEFHIDQDFFIFCDLALFRQAIMNLLDNAIKYSPRETLITVAVTKENTDAVIKIRDNGVGISPEDQKRIFDRFYRVDQSRTRLKGGAGLGLAIVHWIIESHQGKISVQSVAHQGSEFIIKIPLRRNEK